MFVGVFACALMFVGCGDGAPDVAVEDPIKYWKGDSCPISGNKYDAADENDAMQGNIPLEFEHEGMKYEVSVWDEAALDEFHKNKDKYLQKIVDNSE